MMKHLWEGEPLTPRRMAQLCEVELVGATIGYGLNWEPFAEAYKAKLVEAMRSCPDDFMDTPETAGSLAAVMTAKLASGSAHFGTVARKAARLFGITTVSGLRQFLGRREQVVCPECGGGGGDMERLGCSCFHCKGQGVV